MHLFMISLPEPSPRRQSGLTKIKSTGLTYEIVDGVEAAKWRVEEMPVDDSRWERRLIPGEIGCYLAHLRAMRRIVDYDLPWGCILEDDFCFEPAPDLGLGDVESHLPADFHYIHLQRDLGTNRKLQITDQGKYFSRILGTPRCTSGYIISNPLAQFILENHRQCGMPIDHLFSQLSYSGNFYYARKPIVGIQLGLKSTIHK